MLLGFSTGCLYKTHDRLSPETIKLFCEMGCNAIELMCYHAEDAPVLLKLTQEDLGEFEYISIHAPSFKRVSIEQYENALKCFEEFSQRFALKAVVIHPDEIDDWSIFEKYDLPIAIENMDNRKDSCKNVADLQKVFKQIDTKMVLDVNHCFCNDNSMHLAKDLVNAFEKRIEHIHLSGFETFHEPIYRTRQQEIIDVIPDKNLPIIIESVLDDIDEVKKEYEFVKSKLQ